MLTRIFLSLLVIYTTPFLLLANTAHSYMSCSFLSFIQHFFSFQQSLLTHIWGTVDPETIASKGTGQSTGTTGQKSGTVITKDTLLKSKAWNWAAAMMLQKDGIKIDHNDTSIVFHDYNNVECWG